MRALAVSLAIHAIVLWLVAANERAGERPAATPSTRSEARRAQAPIVIEVLEPRSTAGGSSGGSPIARDARPIASHSRPRRTARTRGANAWAGLSIRTDEVASGHGSGYGHGTGTGNGIGIGFGDGGGVAIARDVPPPPVPVAPPPSKARPARLIWPNRDVEVIDDSYLFVARVTVDEDGTVVGAHMLTMRPGSRAERAANAIWQFRYEPALDEHGVPVRSTFEQSFQVR